MTTFHILNGHGHDTTVIDNEDPMSAAAGQAMYRMLRRRGYRAFGGDGADLELIDSDHSPLSFAEVVFVAPVAGG